MAVLTGVGVSPGVRFAPARRLVRDVPEPDAGARHAGDAAAETEQARSALELTAADLTERGRRAGSEVEAVLTAQALMARDPALASDVEKRVAEGVSAARAVYDAFSAYRQLLAAAGGYLAERVADLDDVRDRAVARLLGVPVPGIPVSDQPFVLVAADLSPADTATLDPERVVAIVTREGSYTSHTAILARSLGLPGVVACAGADDINDGHPVLVNGATGEVTTDVDPDSVEVSLGGTPEPMPTPEGPGRTADGHPVALLANIGGPKDVAAARAKGAEGVGLFRTEFLFLDRGTAPSHEEQVAAYRTVLAAFPDAPVVVRTLDAGADKPLAFLPPPAPEPNPALGVRGLRLMSANPETLRGQLAALAEAARDTTAQLRVMAPMVTDAADAAWFVAAGREAGLAAPDREAGQDADQDAGLAALGVMVEVPAAALGARHLASHVDFFSIGTNDLAQYTCAADRESGDLNRFQDPWQPTVLELVALTGAAAAAAGRPCGVCGEAAADPALACVLAGLDITSLSMAAPALPLVRAALAAHTREQCRAAATAARAAASPTEARRAARAELPGLAALGL